MENSGKKLLGASIAGAVGALFVRDTFTWIYEQGLNWVKNSIFPPNGPPLAMPPMPSLDLLDVLGFLLLGVAAVLLVQSAISWLFQVPGGGKAALVEAQAKLAHENRLADKGKRNSPVIDNSSPQSDSTPATNIFFPPTVTQHDPPPFEADYVYVGQIFVEIDKAASERVIFFLFRCFNGSGNGIDIKNPKGRVRFNESKDGSGIDLGDMPAAPFYVDGVKTENVKPGNEFELCLEQRITKDMADRLAEFPNGTSFSFDFEGLDIPLESVRWHNIGRLKLWDGATMFRKVDHIHIGKIVAMKGTATVGTRVR